MRFIKQILKLLRSLPVVVCIDRLKVRVPAELPRGFGLIKIRSQT